MTSGRDRGRIQWFKEACRVAFVSWSRDRARLATYSNALKMDSYRTGSDGATSCTPSQYFGRLLGVGTSDHVSLGHQRRPQAVILTPFKSTSPPTTESKLTGSARSPDESVRGRCPLFPYLTKTIISSAPCAYHPTTPLNTSYHFKVHLLVAIIPYRTKVEACRRRCWSILLPSFCFVYLFQHQRTQLLPNPCATLIIRVCSC